MSTTRDRISIQDAMLAAVPWEWEDGVVRDDYGQERGLGHRGSDWADVVERACQADEYTKEQPEKAAGTRALALGPFQDGLKRVRWVGRVEWVNGHPAIAYRDSGTRPLLAESEALPRGDRDMGSPWDLWEGTEADGPVREWLTRPAEQGAFVPRPPGVLLTLETARQLGCALAEIWLRQGLSEEQRAAWMELDRGIMEVERKMRGE